jgi:hypothetical protein
VKKLKSPYNFSHTQLLVFALFFAAVSGYFIVQSFAATVYYLSPTGNDSNPCTQSQPCKSLGRGYEVASAGDTVEIAGGTYNGDQTIYRDASKTSSTDIIFRPAAGASANFTGEINLSGSHMTMDGSTGSLQIHNFEIEVQNLSDPPTDDVTLKYIDAMHGQSQVQTARNITLSHMKLGGTQDGTDALRLISDDNDNSGSSDDPQNIIIEDSEIGNLFRPGDEHPDCVAVSGGINITFRRNKVWHCATQGFYMIEELGGNISNVTIENNWFGDCDTPGDNATCYNSVIVDRGTMENIVVRYNSFATNVNGGGFRSTGTSPSSIVYVYGNAGEGPSCDEPGTTYDHNVWSNAKCSSTDVQADPGFVKSSGADFNLHLSSANSPAIGKGDSSRFPSTDFDGQTRTSPPDAGADEYGGAGGGTPAPTVSLSASPTSITSGQSSTLFWNSTNATSCTASGAWSGTKAVSGNQLLSPTSTSTYTLTCTGTGGSGSASATVTVTTVSAKPGDLNGDGQVNITDLSILLTNYNSSNAAADINNDGSVNILDLSILLSNYGA